MKTLAIIAFLTIALGRLVFAGPVDSEFLSSYWQDETEMKPILIVLSKQVNLTELNQEFDSRKLPLAVRHSILMDSLQAASLSSEAALKKPLEILERNGMISNLRRHWLINCLTADATRAGAELVANIADVAEVGAVEMISARPPVEAQPSEVKLLNVEASLKTLRAPEVWANGFYGTGRIVCWLDQAVAVDHPALASRWRGTTAPHAECFYGAANLIETCASDRLQTLGTICGADPSRGDTIGIAPGASWIGGRLFCRDESSFEELLNVLEWAVDPDGNSATFEDVPDVICMAWQVGTACNSKLPDGVWKLFEHVEQLGPVCIFAASNQGERGAGSVTLPEAFGGLPDDIFSVGNLDATSPTTRVHASSGRGPSPCDPQRIQPDIVAPGTKIRTAAADGYELSTGTCVAAGFAAGTIALMREANPELTAREAKQILRDTATDLGLSGPDNTYGWGLLNTAKAVEAAKNLGSSGTITGRVRYGGIPLGDARVDLVSAFDTHSTFTLPNGSFEFRNLPTDREYGLQIGRFGFATYINPEPILLEKNGKHSAHVNLSVLIRDDVEFDQGWLLGIPEDDASGGIWERDIPVASYENGVQVQVGEDASDSGEYCFFTGNASENAPAGSADVDGGRTTLRSPVFSLRELEDPTLTFSYAYSNDKGGRKGGDFFRAQISEDGGETWVDLIRSSAGTKGWQEVSLKLADFIDAPDRVVLQFVAADRPPATLVEAAVDEISITGRPGAPEPPRDLNLDVQFDQVVLTWRPSNGARVYNIYIADDPGRIVLPENFFAETPDTVLIIPMNEIPFDQFYFQVTASR